MTLCLKCRRSAPEGASFCPFCGTRVTAGPQSAPPADPYIGRKINKAYFIQQRIGEGATGVVYRALQVGLDRPVAIKLLRKAALSDASTVERFQREARAASRLRHANVIQVSDFGETEDGTFFIAMEYVPGRSLRVALREESPFGQLRATHVGEQLLGALAEAHAHDVVHRDLRPENVMLELRQADRDFVKVLDFGMAKLCEPLGGGPPLTLLGAPLGAPDYLSPEQLEGRVVDARCDVYAAGILLYEMAAGRHPFQGSAPADMQRSHLLHAPPPLVSGDVAISADFEAVVLRALQKDPADRFATAAEMRAALLACSPAPDDSASGRTPSAGTLVMPAWPTLGTLVPPEASPRLATQRTPVPQEASPRQAARPTSPAAPPPLRLEKADEPEWSATGRGTVATSPRPRGRAAASPPPRTDELAFSLQSPDASGAASQPSDQADGERTDDTAPLPPPPPAPPRPGPRRAPGLRDQRGREGASRKTVAIVTGAGIVLVAALVAYFWTHPPWEGEAPAAKAAASREGAQPATGPASVRAAQPVPAASPTPLPSAGAGTTRAAESSASPGAPTATATAPSEPAAAPDEGVLVVTTRPPGMVWVAERKIGTSPSEVRLRAGTYRVMVFHREYGSRAHEVTVSPGRQTRYHVDFKNHR